MSGRRDHVSFFFFVWTMFALARVMVDGLDEFYKEVSSRGANVISQPADRAYGLREFVIRTPDGHRLMFAERLEQPRAHG